MVVAIVERGINIPSQQHAAKMGRIQYDTPNMFVRFYVYSIVVEEVLCFREELRWSREGYENCWFVAGTVARRICYAGRCSTRIYRSEQEVGSVAVNKSSQFQVAVIKGHDPSWMGRPGFR